MRGRLFRAIFLVLTMASLEVGGVPGARAAEPPPATIAFVDVQLVLRETQAAKALRSRIEQEQFSYQSDLAKRENALRAASETLSTTREDLAEAEYIRRRQEIDQQVADLRRESQMRKRQLEQAYNDGMDRIRAAMVQAVAEIAGERGLSIVINKAAVVLGSTELDLTEEVIERVDAALPAVEGAAPQ